MNKTDSTESLMNMYDFGNTKWEQKMPFNKNQIVEFLKKIILQHK